jgi:hypothetical protein
MLSTFHHPATISFGNPVEGVPTVQGFSNSDIMSQLIPTFKLPKRGGKPEDEDSKEDPNQVDLIEGWDEENSITELFRIVFDISFDEMLTYLLEPGHEKIVRIRNRINMKKRGEKFLFLAPRARQTDDLQSYAENLYELQFQLFETSKGFHVHVII